MSAFPSITPSQVEWQKLSHTQSFQSALDRSVQTLALTGARWMATLRFRNLPDTDARTLIAFLASLSGQSGRFTLHDHSHPNPSGIATGTPLIKGASQTGKSIITDGWTTSQTGILKAGDWVGFNGELRMQTVDVDSDVSGNATLTLDEPVRSSPADNAVITTVQPTATMMLKDDGQAKWQANPALTLVHNITLTCVETFV